MRNWVSNDRRVLSHISATELFSNMRDIAVNTLPTERTLGLQWDTNSDMLTISLNIPMKLSTRRGILSCFSSLYNHFGFVSPWLIPGNGLKWDEQLSVNERSRWENWISNLRSQKMLQLARCLKPKGISDLLQTELHVFCDASEVAYSVVAYARFSNETQNLHCSLIWNSKERQFMFMFLSQCDSLDKLVNRFSSWTRLQRTVVWLLRFMQYIIVSAGKAPQETLMMGHIRVTEMRQATNGLIKYVQCQRFTQELTILQSTQMDADGRRKTVRSSGLRRLCPDLINGTMRVGGRLNYSSYNESFKHPMILPNCHPGTDLIINYFHELEEHREVAQVLGAIRQNFWIVKGSASVKRVLGACL
ncbi:unnamed protein product [Dibothriocephalus latus]|uniref:Uncharacterized protein n=1 Tax=Dibothriocephalus latus TaxID=60516 RepID=A0A3P7MV47_DIBLA|nr:unnamed protein product [Dibothriocephalus latus]